MKPKPLGMFGLIVFLIILFVCVSTSILYPQPRPRSAPEEQGASKETAYIDCHNHLAGRYGTPGRVEEQDFEGAAKVALSAMDQYGITKMIIMPPPFTPQQPHVYDYAELMGVVKQHPGRFAFLGGGGTLNLMIHRTANEREISPELRDRFKKAALEILARGALGFGEMAAEHFSLGPDHPYESVPPDHPLFLLLADIAAEYDVPIDIHMEAIPEEMPLPEGLSSPPNPKVLRPNIAAFERLLAHNRKAKIIWAHAGWCNTGRRTASLCSDLLKKYPNLYMSFKISPKDCRPECMPIEQGRGLKTEWLQLIQEFPDRFIIGTDQFYVSPRSPLQGIGPIKIEPMNRFRSLLPPDLARKIGEENPRHIFNIAY
jgi:predicted TIM-barrel fold metal-dependent hydrolase